MGNIKMKKDDNFKSEKSTKQTNIDKSNSKSS
jgi:hypothetical protein